MADDARKAEQLPTGINVTHARLPASYERAKAALAECERIDEVQDWSDKAAAIAAYARMRDDETLIGFAMRIRARAVRRLGELLREFDGRGRRQNTVSNLGISQREAAARAGISEHRQLQAVRVANVPAAEFEAAVERPRPMTVVQIADIGRKPRGQDRITTDPALVIEPLRYIKGCCTRTDPTTLAQITPPENADEGWELADAVEKWAASYKERLRRPTTH